MMQAASLASSRRREKPILSCTFCRGRKLRCDRESPCGTCVQRGRAGECAYPTPEQERKVAVDYRPHHGRTQARQRFARLENMVLEMRDRDLARSSINGTSVRASSPRSNGQPVIAPPTNLADDMGKLSITDDQAVYTGGSHWVTILEDIRRLKDELSGDNDEYSATDASHAPSPVNASSGAGSPDTRVSLLGYAPYVTRDYILAMLPPRKAVDRHVSLFFNGFDMASFLIHRKTFLVEYANFWNNPSAVPIMWVGLLFSILGVSAHLLQKDSPSSELGGQLETCRTATVHCLIAGDYLNQSRYTMETLSLHFALGHNHSMDASVSNWFLLGLVIRIAMRMGLHRDPSHWPNLRPLQAELRRRIWTTLYQMDFFTSTQMGLPRIIKDSQCDTRLPAHLFEHDLDLGHQELPPERPRDEPTALLFIIERQPIIQLAAEIYDSTEAGPPSPATIAALDSKIQHVLEIIPHWLKYRPPEASIAESPSRILQQIFMDILVNKAIYLLHRRSFVKGATTAGETSARSNEICINAALAILAHQRRMSEETEPGGLMFSVRWKVSSSLNHELLQATMMLCFALSRSRDGANTGGSIVAGRETTLLRRNDIVEALTHARSYWEEIADQSVDARRAAQAINAVLQRDSDKAGPRTDTPAPDAFSETMPGMADPDYFGAFDFGEDMAGDGLNHPFVIGDDSLPTFESLLDGFVAEQNHVP